MKIKPLDDDYRQLAPLPYEDTICPHCGSPLEWQRCIDCELRLEAEQEALEGDE